MIDPNLDGISHVNIYSQGKTELGRMLSNFTYFKTMTKDGWFNSVEGYWHWLGIEDCSDKEILRTLSGYNAKKTGSELKKNFNSRIDDDFENKILTAIWYKVKRNSNMFFTEVGKLPFEHYYNFSGKLVDAKSKYSWMIEGIDKMRNYILKGEK